MTGGRSNLHLNSSSPPSSSPSSKAEKIEVRVPVSYAVSVTSLAGEMAMQQFETRLYPILMRLWRREELRRRPSRSHHSEPTGTKQAKAIAESAGTQYMQTVNITVSAEDACRHYPPTDTDRSMLELFEDDPDLRRQRDLRRAEVQQLIDNGEPLLPEDLRGCGVLHYVARRRTRRTDINRALWGNKIELWCKEDEFCARHQPGYDDDEHGHDEEHH